MSNLDQRVVELIKEIEIRLDASDNRVQVLSACVKSFERDISKLEDRYANEHTENAILKDATKQVIEFLRVHSDCLRLEGKTEEAFVFTSVALKLELMISSPERNDNADGISDNG